MAELKSKVQTDNADLAYAYSLIHAFLTERSHKKVASALKQAVHGIAIKEGVDYKGPSLQQILKEWKELKGSADAGESTSSDSDSDSEISNDDSSSDDDSDVENNATVKKTGELVPSESPGLSTPRPESSLAYTDSDDSSDDSDDSDGDDTGHKAVQRVANVKESQRDSSKTLSSADDGDSDEESTNEDSSEKEGSDADSDITSGSDAGAGKRKTIKGALKPKISSESSSDSTSGSDCESDSDEEENPPKANRPTHKAKSPSSDSSSGSSSDSDSDIAGGPPKTTELKSKATPTSSSSDSGSSSDSDSENESISEDAKPSKKRSTAQPITRSSSSSSESEDELEETPASSAAPDPDVQVMKKRRTNEEGGAMVTASVKIVSERPMQGGNASRKSNTPFQRIKAEVVTYGDEKLKDNTFESRGARVDDYGAQASRDLIVTRGNGFRKEKSKKKRGSYRGGDITLHSHSFKFDA